MSEDQPSTSTASSTTLTTDQVVPGTTLPKSKVEGRLVILWNGLGNDKLRLYFAVKVRLTVAGNDYASGTEVFQLRIKVFSNARKRLEADHEALEEAQRSKGVLSIDLSGAKIVSVEMDEKKRTKIVHMECDGPRKVKINGAARVLGGYGLASLTEGDEPKTSEWFHSPPPEDAGIGRTQSMPMRPVSSHLGTLTFFSDSPGLKRANSNGGGLSKRPRVEWRKEPQARELTGAATEVTTMAAGTSTATTTIAQRFATVRKTRNGPLPIAEAAEPPAHALIDLSTTRSAAPLEALDATQVRFLPTPSTATSSRPDTIESPPSSSLPASGAVAVASPGAAIPPTSPSVQQGSPATHAPLARLHAETNSVDVPKTADSKEELAAQARRRLEYMEAEEKRRTELLEVEVKRKLEREVLEAKRRQQLEEARRKRAAEDEDARRQRVQEVAAAAKRQKKAEALAEAEKEIVKRRAEEASEAAEPAPAQPLNDADRRRKAAQDKALQKAEEARAAKWKAEQEQAAHVQELSNEFRGVVDGQERVYKTCSGLLANTFANVMGVIVEIMGEPRYISAHRNYMMTVIIGDPTTHTLGISSDDLNISIFRMTAAELQHLQVGMPVLFRSIKVNMWNDRPKGNLFVNAANEWYALSGQNVLRGDRANPTQGTAPPLAPQEKQRLMALRSWWQSLYGGIQTQPTTAAVSNASNTSSAPSATNGPTRGKKFKTLDQVKHRDYFHVFAKVLAVEKANNSSLAFEVYITDGTVNAARTRNFHGVSARNIPPSAIFCLAIFNDVVPTGRSEELDRVFKAGHYVKFPNLRCMDRDGLELKWSDKMTQDQFDKGWREKMCSIISADSPEAIEIEKRLKALAKGSAASVPAPVSVPAALSAPVNEAPPPPIPMLDVANHISTRHTDEHTHPITPLANILKDHTSFQRFRTRAKVSRIIGRSAKGSKTTDLAVINCTKCSQPFAGDYCKSCNDKSLARAEVVYQMILELESKTKMYVVLAGKEAEAILPPLPMVHGGPNEVKRTRAQISALTRGVEAVLLGNLMDGERTHPVIDWSLESFYDGRKGEMVRIWRVFGMSCKDR